MPRKTNSEPSTIYHALNASFAICRKDKKVVARKLGQNAREIKLAFGSLSLKCLAGLCIRGLKLDYRQRMHKPHDGGKEDVLFLRQEQGSPRFNYIW
jgi:hypothetical protein